MAEAVAAIGLISSIISLIEFSNRVVSRLREFSDRTNELPETFRTLAIQLPLLNITLKRIEQQAKADLVESDIENALSPVVKETARWIRYLDGQLVRLTPPTNASTLDRGLVALRSIARENDIIRATDKIHDCIRLLVLHQTTTGVTVSGNVLDRIVELQTRPASSSAAAAAVATVNVPSIILVHEAIERGELPSLRAMSRLGADFNLRDDSGRTTLHVAAQSGRVNVTGFILETTHDLVNARDDAGRTPCHVAVIAGHIDVAYFLLQNGAQNDIQDDQGKTLRDHVQSDFLARWQLQFGPDIDSRDPQTGNSALIQASSQGDQSAVARIINAGADVMAKNHTLSTPLAEACIKGHHEVIALLLNAGADPNTVDQQNWSPFTRCVWANQIEALEQLIDGGTVNVNINTTSTAARHSILAEAATNGQWSVMKVLLRNGADPNSNGSQRHNRSILKVTMPRCKDIELVGLLLSGGADANTTDTDGWSPMKEAVELRDWDLMKLLLAHGASPNGTHNGYPFICRLAYWKMGLTAVRALVRYGADVNARNPDGWSAIHEAVDWSNIDWVRELLSLGANANIRLDSLRWRRNVPLLLASVWIEKGRRHSLDVIDALLSSGAGLEDTDAGGWTALRAAVESERESAARLLFTRGANARAVANDGRTPIERARAHGLKDFCALVDAVGTNMSF